MRTLWPVFQRDKGSVHGLLQLDGGAGWKSLGQGGVAGGQNADGLPLDELVSQAGEPSLCGGEGQVHFPFQHHLFQHGAARLPQLQTDMGKGFDKLGQDLREQPGRALHADAKPQPAPVLLADLLDLIF